MTIYRIHVSLLDIKPLIWRRVELSGQTTLKQFHRILQIVMGWENYHLHEFLVGTKRYGVRTRPTMSLAMSSWKARSIFPRSCPLPAPKFATSTTSEIIGNTQSNWRRSLQSRRKSSTLACLTEPEAARRRIAAAQPGTPICSKSSPTQSTKTISTCAIGRRSPAPADASWRSWRSGRTLDRCRSVYEKRFCTK